MRKTFAVARREFMATVATKGFIFGVVMTPLLMVVAIGGVFLLMNKAAPRVEGRIGVIDRTGVVAPRIAAAFTPEAVKARRDAATQKGIDAATKVVGDGMKKTIEDQAEVAKALNPDPSLKVEQLPADGDAEAAKKEIMAAAGREKDAAGSNPRLALVVIPESALEPGEKGSFGGYDMFVAPKLDPEVQGDIKDQVSRAVVDARIERSGMDVAKVRALVERPKVEARAITAEGERKTNEVASFLIPAGFMILLWVSVFTAGQFLLTSTIEEKSNRVMEVLLSAVSPMQLMVGKIFGQMGVGLLILVMYGSLGIGSLIVFSFMHLLDPMGLVYLAIFFVLAFFMIASMMAAIGSAVSDVREAQALIGPVMIVLIIPMMLWMPIMRNPNSMFAQVCSFIPPINPFIMVLRLSGSEKIPAWQVPASIAVGVVGAVVMAWAAAKIFRIGALMYGKPPNFRTLIKWVRMA